MLLHSDPPVAAHAAGHFEMYLWMIMLMLHGEQAQHHAGTNTAGNLAYSTAPATPHHNTSTAGVLAGVQTLASDYPFQRRASNYLCNTYALMSHPRQV